MKHDRIHLDAHRQKSLIPQIILFLSIFLLPHTDLKADLMDDLLVVDQVNRQINDRLPVTYNHFLQGGYLNMPSARGGEEGEVAAGYAHLPPYRIYSLRAQPYNFLELTGNYRVFHGIPDPVLGATGYGDYTDKGVNAKLILLRPEESGHTLPGLAIGFDDFIGTRSFSSQYIVLTKVWPRYDLELSLGYGRKRIKGFFGGVQWMPWRRCENTLFDKVSFVAEYDATCYKHSDTEPHPDGRTRKTHWNGGIKYRFANAIDLSASIVRGKEFAFSVSGAWNLGYSPGLVHKYRDPLPYCSPINTQKIGCLRPEDFLFHELSIAFREQGFDLIEGWSGTNACCEALLYLTVLNIKWLSEDETCLRLNELLARLIPSNIDKVIVSLANEGFACQEYHYRTEDLFRFQQQEIGSPELSVLVTTKEVTHPDPSLMTKIFTAPPSACEWILKPKVHNYFGSSKGKYKCAAGIRTGIEGFLTGGYYYQVLFGWIIASELDSARAIDRLNPSQIINVHSDAMLYYKQRGVTLDVAYLQKGWNLGKGWYSKAALGCFERAYGGAALEFLYYPVDSAWAIGIEGASLFKRSYDGYSFTNKVRKLDGYTPSYRKFYGSQYFIDLYYDLNPAKIFFTVSAGKFLANDWGARCEATRYFDNGVELTVWYTATNGHDTLNGHCYHDKGVAFSIPLDIFYPYSTRDRWDYQLAAWLRDVGYRSSTGNNLFDIIRSNRE